MCDADLYAMKTDKLFGGYCRSFFVYCMEYVITYETYSQVTTS